MTTALYRRYRPETFAEVIGQDHVTGPLRQALRSGQVNHAYLFSGPRGCGKTTSARILARVLNCVENTEGSPTDTPCGVCPSCVELARGGPGSLDVVEIDAASHGGVDDARELRERATFAPARDRYKVFIIDEAHMVSNQGFNALLKIVEEPPPHVKFIFATTEPEKVIGTIRSRTHHYPFRLVPPDVLLPYLEGLCGQEGVPVGSGVLPLVVRAGGGSVRDTLSVLDQLIAGAGEGGLEYEGAAALLGYTQATLLDDLVEAIAARDGASAFRVVDRVVSTGHEPRRFVEDLLERLRDLIVIAAAGEAAGAALRGLPSDQLDRMRAQSAHLGAAELSRSADLANAALTEMTGATPPRLHLELLMARLLLPAADDSRAGVGARLDRLERGLASGGAVAGGARPVTGAAGAAGGETPAGDDGSGGVAGDAPAVPAPSAAVTATGRPDEAAADRSAQSSVDEADGPSAGGSEASPQARRDGPGMARWDEVADAQQVAGTPPPPGVTLQPAGGAVSGAQLVSGAAPQSGATPPGGPLPERGESSTPPSEPGAEAEVVPGPATQGAAAAETELLRRRWAEVLDTIKRLRRATSVLVDANAQVASLDATTLRLSFTTDGLARSFRDGKHAEVVAQAVRETLGFDVRVEAVSPGTGGSPAGGPGGPGVGGTGTGAPGTGGPGTGRPAWGAPSSAGATGGAPGTRGAGGGPGDRRGDEPTGRSADEATGREDRRGGGTGDVRQTTGPSADGTDGRMPGSAGEHGTSGDPGVSAEDTSDDGGRPASEEQPRAGSETGSARTEPVRPGPTSGPSADTGSARAGSARAGSTPAGSARAGSAPTASADGGYGGSRVMSAAEAVASWDDLPPTEPPEHDPYDPGEPAGGVPGDGGAASVLARGGPGGRGGRDADGHGAAGQGAGARPAGGGPATVRPSAEVERSAGGGGRVGTGGMSHAPGGRSPAPEASWSSEPDEPSPDDPDIASSGLVGAPLVAQLLGGTVIDEQLDDPLA